MGIHFSSFLMIRKMLKKIFSICFLAAFFVSTGWARTGNNEQGYIDGQYFYHPKLGLQFEVPTGFSISNSPDAVEIVGATGVAMFTASPYDGNLHSYAAKAFDMAAGQNKVNARQEVLCERGDFPCVRIKASYSTNGQKFELNVYAFEIDAKHAYHFMIATKEGQNTLASLPASLSRYDAKALAIAKRPSTSVPVKFSYDGTFVEGKAAEFDILGVRLNEPLYPSLEAIRSQGFVCRDKGGGSLSFDQRVQKIVNERTGAKGNPVYSPYQFLCTKAGDGSVEIKGIPTPTGFRVFSILRSFNSKGVDPAALKRRIYEKYGQPNSVNYWCWRHDITFCQEASLTYNEGLSYSNLNLHLTMPKYYQSDIDRLSLVRADMLRPRTAEAKF